MTQVVGDRRGAAVHDAPARGPRRALLPLVIVAGGITLAVTVQQIFDPFRTDIPLCVVYHLTGLHCPGCGAIRGVHALLAGDLLLALRSNALIMAALPVAALSFGVWTLHRIQGRPTHMPLPRPLVVALLAAIILFTVLRNIPAFWFLAPISYVGA
ncbi:hypothetical protein BH708_01905 [Brachybacterium sp. P6-10-X1]|uniref:DUF2752 domain-containing protein n=1 Tax=Brachybacterium sp. P6-10-X1 TaxID=1903186 RepID=UPI000971A2D5|nr:DUF2752 domain-containing protein [Brachybacterium sp. P6-10-X1]APX31680.1 hypothetical protein BH708_01905 [Brachybacterium sp. P6-10-X1]